MYVLSLIAESLDDWRKRNQSDVDVLAFRRLFTEFVILSLLRTTPLTVIIVPWSNIYHSRNYTLSCFTSLHIFSLSTRRKRELFQKLEIIETQKLLSLKKYYFIRYCSFNSNLNDYTKLLWLYKIHKIKYSSCPITDS